jgi:hypothetical protein
LILALYVHFLTIFPEPPVGAVALQFEALFVVLVVVLVVVFVVVCVLVAGFGLTTGILKSG